MRAHELCHLSLREWTDLPLEARLRLAASCFLGWDYPAHTRENGAPFAGPGLPARDTRRADCSVFAAALIMAAYPLAAWTPEDYHALAIWEGQPMDAPVHALARHGVGIPADLEGPGWRLCQGWRPNGTGHTWLCRPHEGALLALDSSPTHGVGPRSRVVTAADLRSEYRRRIYAARLVERVEAT